MTFPLLSTCVLPGCTIPVVHVGEPCERCQTAFGDLLQPTDGPAMTAEQISRRDSATRNAYQVQRWIRGER